MWTRGPIVTIAAALLVLAWSAEARAQATPYELNLHAGVFNADDERDDSDVLLGARIMLQYPSGWGWGGNFDWIAQDEFRTGPDSDADANLYLYSFEIDYTFAPGSQLRPFVGGGIGAATFKITDIGPDDDEDFSETNVLVPLAGGVKWFNNPANPTWAIRGEVRDNIIFVDDEGGDGLFVRDDDGATNNWELSGGVSFFF